MITESEFIAAADRALAGIGAALDAAVARSAVELDWGLTDGVCRHQDTKAQADFIFADPDVLALTVTRGKTRVVQEWTRVQ